MKLVIRTTAIAAFVLTAAFASTQVSAAPTAKVTATRNSAMPVPTCAPDDPNACGMHRL